MYNMGFYKKIRARVMFMYEIGICCGGESSVEILCFFLGNNCGFCCCFDYGSCYDYGCGTEIFHSLGFLGHQL